MSFSFIHAADLHIDTPFVGLSHLPHRIREQVKESTFAALDNLVQLCLEREVDFLVIAGDIYDSADRSLTAQLRFQQAMQRLASEGIHVFIAHGNHDPLDGYRAKLSWSENVHVFSSESVESISFFKNQKEAARIYGISYPTSQVTERLVNRFRRDPSTPYAIGVLHTNVGGHPQHGNYAPCTIEELIAGHMDYWALGHIHTRQVLRDQHPTILYPGNIQGRSMKETGEKGCILVNVSNVEAMTSFSFHALDVIRWLEVSIVMEEDATEQDLIDRLDDEIQCLKERIGNRSLIVRFHLKVGQELAELFNRQAFVQDVLHRYRVEQTPFVWLQGITVENLPMEEEDPFVLEMLEWLSHFQDDPEIRSRFLQEAWSPLLFEHRLGSKWLTQLTKEPIDWEKEIQDLIRQRK